jgi:hypothetical protein
MNPARGRRQQRSPDEPVARLRAMATSGVAALPIGRRLSACLIVQFLLVLIVPLAPCATEGRAQEQTFDRESYYRAVDYCRHSAQPDHPMNLSPDKQVLCLTGVIAKDLDTSPANDLKDNGLFVIRSPGGNARTAIALSDIIRNRRATVVVYDYCFSACAGFLLVASHQTYVLKSTVVAWHHFSGGELCTFLTAPRDGGPRRLQRGPCQHGGEYGFTNLPMLIKFFKERAVNPPISFPPDSLHTRKILRDRYAGTGVFYDTMWALHPRYYPRLFKTKIIHEAYPESQDEVDGILASLGLKTRVIYDP